MSYRLKVRRSELEEVCLEDIADTSELSLREGEAVLAIEKYGLMANNVSYAVVGDEFGYWEFFPADDGWGVIPAWGVGRVVKSNNSTLETGQRYYGFYPMASYLVVSPDDATRNGFVDTSAHRASLPPSYNRYEKMTEARGFLDSNENHQIVYRPLFFTSYVLANFVLERDLFGAKTVVISSASSKTSIGVAFWLKENAKSLTIGITSKGNVKFVESTGLYDQVIDYDSVDELAAAGRLLLIDIAGSDGLAADMERIHGDKDVVRVNAGMTHWKDRSDTKIDTGADTFFFAPTEITSQVKKLGGEKFRLGFVTAWTAFLEHVGDWIAFEQRSAPTTLVTTYKDVLNGRVSPTSAFVIENRE